MSNPLSPFRLNVGFIIAQGIGYTRDFAFDVPVAHLPPDLELENLTGTVRVTRTPQGLPIQSKMKAYLPSECVRCLEHFNQPLDIDFTEMYAFSRRSTDESELLVPEDGHIDLEPLIREYMLLEIPINALCRPDCQGLCPVCGQNLNENRCGHTPEEVDPRLSVLKELLDKDKNKKNKK